MLAYILINRMMAIAISRIYRSTLIVRNVNTRLKNDLPIVIVYEFDLV